MRRPFQSHVDSWFKDGSNTKHCAMTLAMREAPLLPLLLLDSFPLPVSEVKPGVSHFVICLIYILIFISPLQPSPQHRLCFHASHHFSSLAPASEMGCGVVCGGALKASSHQPLDPRQGPGQSRAIHQSPANASTGIAARRVRRTACCGGDQLWRLLKNGPDLVGQRDGYSPFTCETATCHLQTLTLSFLLHDSEVVVA